MDFLKNMNNNNNTSNKLNKAEIMQSLWAIVGQSSAGEFISCARDVIRSIDNKTTVKSSPVVSPKSDETIFPAHKPEQANNVSFPRCDSEPGKSEAQKRKEWQSEIERKYCTKLISQLESLTFGDTFEMEFDQADFGNNNFGAKGKIYQKDTTKVMYRWDNDVKYSLVWFFNTFKKSKDIQNKMSFKVEVPSASEESGKKPVIVIFSNDPEKFNKKVDSTSMPIIERNTSSPIVHKDLPIVPINVGVDTNQLGDTDNGPSFS